MEKTVDRKLKVIWLALIGGASVCLSIAVFYLGPRPGGLVGVLLLPVIAFSILAYAMRWLVLRDPATRALSEKILLVVGGAKITLFLALILLILECVIIAVVRPDARGAMLGTFVTGMVAFAILNIALTGVVNSFMIVRKLTKQ
jgi:hypothetical protein